MLPAPPSTRDDWNSWREGGPGQGRAGSRLSRLKERAGVDQTDELEALHVGEAVRDCHQLVVAQVQLGDGVQPHGLVLG